MDGVAVKPAAFVSDGHSLALAFDELREFKGKIFAMPKAQIILEDAGIHAQSLGDPMGIKRIFGFGHKEIHLFGFDLCHEKEEGTRICYESRVFFTTPEYAAHAQMLMHATLELMEKGAQIAVHGDGMLAHMARSVMRQASERVLNAVYDLTVCPPTFEVFSFLAEAERYRVANGFTAMDVLFMPGPMHGFRDDGLPPSAAEREGMLYRVCAAGARLLPSVRNVHVMRSRAHVGGDIFPPDWTNDRPRFLYGPRYQKNGFKCLAATQAARDEINRRFPHPFSTITLREAEYWPKRNSDKRAWDCAARDLRARGIPAIIIPDTHGTGITGHQSFEPAAWDVDLRLALYESAKLNLGVTTGPMAMLCFTLERCPYIVFQKPDDESPANQKQFMDANGMAPGTDWTDDGWTQWQDDTPDNVLRSIADWFERAKAKAA